MDKLLVTEIERSAIHDGPGIRTVVFLQGCPLHCPWCCNPETQPLHAVLLHNNEKCVGCGACAAVCPKQAVSLSAGKAKIDRTRCIGCGACDPVCPTGANALSAREYPVEEVLALVLRDRPYFEATGGGITLSGGEPLLQAPAAAKLLQGCKEAGISTWIETTANVPFSSLELVLPYTDGLYIDYKHSDGGWLRHSVGGNLPLLEENLSRLAERGTDFTLRTPVIPNCNEDVIGECLRASQRFGRKTHVLLPYHALGKNKYERLGLCYGMGEERTRTADDLSAYRRMGESLGIAVQIGG